mgnify:FL=1
MKLNTVYLTPLVYKNLELPRQENQVYRNDILYATITGKVRAGSNKEFDLSVAFDPSTIPEAKQIKEAEELIIKNLEEKVFLDDKPKGFKDYLYPIPKLPVISLQEEYVL